MNLLSVSSTPNMSKTLCGESRDPNGPALVFRTWPCVSEKTQTSGSQFRALYDITTGLSTAEGPPLEPDWEMNGLVPEQGRGRKEKQFHVL